jgi:RNA polymerase-binding transcription factor DksA
MTKVKQYVPRCMLCGEPYPLERLHIGYAVCLECGDEIAKDRKFTVVPMNKSNYMMVTDMSLLKQLNPKRTT